MQQVKDSLKYAHIYANMYACLKTTWYLYTCMYSTPNLGNKRKLIENSAFANNQSWYLIRIYR